MKVSCARCKFLIFGNFQGWMSIVRSGFLVSVLEFNSGKYSTSRSLLINLDSKGHLITGLHFGMRMRQQDPVGLSFKNFLKPPQTQDGLSSYGGIAQQVHPRG